MAADLMKLICWNRGKYKSACQISEADSAIQAIEYILLKGLSWKGRKKYLAMHLSL